ncbi:MAG: hypothetical protein RIT81_22200 [Deltaproteobacteria bacterium]
MRALKRTLPERILRRLTRHPVMVVSTLSLSFRVGKDAFSLKKGEIDPPEFRKRTGSHLGTLGGGLAGAAAGAAAGSVVPGIGTIIGTFAGGMVGEMAGGRIGREAVERAEELVRSRSAPGETPESPAAEEGPARPEPIKRHL